ICSAVAHVGGELGHHVVTLWLVLHEDVRLLPEPLDVAQLHVGGPASRAKENPGATQVEVRPIEVERVLRLPAPQGLLVGSSPKSRVLLPSRVSRLSAGPPVVHDLETRLADL